MNDSMNNETEEPLPPETVTPKKRRKPSPPTGEPITPVEENPEQNLVDLPELPDYEDTDTSSRHGRHFLRNLLGDTRVLVTLGILIVTLLAWIAVPPLYQKLKVRRAMQFLEQSRMAADEGNIPKSISLMRKAILMAPSNEEVFRKVRLYNAMLGDPSALSVLQGLMLEKQATAEELLTLAQQALAAGNTTIAKAALDQLADNHSVKKTIIQMQILENEGNREGAVNLARLELPALSPADAEELLLATAKMTLKSDVKASRQILIQFMGHDSPTGIAALRLLATQQLSQPVVAETRNDKVAEKIIAHPLRTPDDVLLALDLQIKESPSSKPALIARTASERTNALPDDALAFARWLNRRLNHKEAIEFIGRDRAISSPDWLLIYLDGLAGMERWDDIFSILDAETIAGLSDSIRLLFLARAAKKSGNQERADESWREMQLGLLYEKPEVLSFIAAYALRIGEREQAMKAYKTLSNRRETALEGMLGLIRCSPQNAPATDLLPLYEELTEAFPMLAEARNDQTYLKLLTDKNPADVAAIAKNLYENEPESIATLSIAALGLLKTGRPSEADAIYNGKVISWRTAPPPWKVVRAAILYELGKKTEADELVAGINKNNLRPEEIALISSGPRQ